MRPFVELLDPSQLLHDDACSRGREMWQTNRNAVINNFRRWVGPPHFSLLMRDDLLHPYRPLFVIQTDQSVVSLVAVPKIVSQNAAGRQYYPPQ
jgi:hypothetical protein